METQLLQMFFPCNAGRILMSCVLCGCVFQWTATRARPTPVSTAGAVCRRATAIAATVLRASPGRAARSVSHWKEKKKLLFDPKNSEVSCCRLLGQCNTRAVWGGGEKHMLSSTSAHVSDNEFRRRKFSHVSFFSSAFCLSVHSMLRAAHLSVCFRLRPPDWR